MFDVPATGPDRFARELARRGIATPIRRLPDSTRTASEAAAALGCDVANIAKSIVFRDRDNDAPLLVIASGVNRVDTARLAQLAGVGVATADADFVRDHTGFAIGGVPPFGHSSSARTFIDEDLFGLGQVWAAAGGPREVFATTAQQLLDVTDGTRAVLKA